MPRFFCPAFGHNSVLTTSSERLASQKRTIQNGASFREALEAQCGKDAAVSAWRHLIEHSLGNVFSTFEHFTQTKFRTVPNVAEPKRGAFQRLDEASAQWRSVGVKGYDQILSPHEYRKIKMLVQQRHLITHRNGIGARL